MDFLFWDYVTDMTGSQGARSRRQQRDPEEGKNRVACGGGYPPPQLHPF